MSNTLSFQDIIKWIHPDTADSSIKDPTDKVIEATRYHNDEEALYRLAIQWRLLQDDKGDFVPQYKMNEGKNLQMNGIHCIIMETYWKNNKLTVVLYNSEKRSFQKFERADEWDQDKDFFVTGINMSDQYIDLDYKYQLMKMRSGI